MHNVVFANFIKTTNATYTAKKKKKKMAVFKELLF